MKKTYKLRNIKHNKITIKNKIIKNKDFGKNRNARDHKITKSNISGGGIFNSIAHFAIHEERVMKVPYFSPIGKFFNDKSLFAKTNPNIFRASFNYGSAYQIELIGKTQIPIPNSKVQTEPHLFIPNMNRYIFFIIELPPYSRLLWLAVYNNRSKEHTYQSYLPPMITVPGSVRNYRLQAYKYPKETPPYVTLDTPLSGRSAELIKFKTYLQLNAKFVGQQPVFIRNFRVKYDQGNALVSFLGSSNKNKMLNRNRSNKVNRKS